MFKLVLFHSLVFKVGKNGIDSQPLLKKCITAPAEFGAVKLIDNLRAALLSVAVHIHNWSNNSPHPCLLFMCVNTCVCVAGVFKSI